LKELTVTCNRFVVAALIPCYQEGVMEDANDDHTDSVEDRTPGNAPDETDTNAPGCHAMATFDAFHKQYTLQMYAQTMTLAVLPIIDTCWS
jgi:hypothetical protein